MDRVTIFKVNDVISQLHKIEVVPDSELTRITGEQEEILVEHLVKPIKFRFVTIIGLTLEEINLMFYLGALYRTQF